MGSSSVPAAVVALPSSGRAETLAQDGVEWFTNVPVTTQDGQTLQLYDDVTKGKILHWRYACAASRRNG